MGHDANLEYWLRNDNFKVRDYQIKEAFRQTESRMEQKQQIDSIMSGTTCVMTFFNHDMVLCANTGDSRAILISEHDDEDQQKNANIGKYYYTQLSRDHKPDLPEEAARILAKHGRIEPSRVTNDIY